MQGKPSKGKEKMAKRIKIVAQKEVNIESQKEESKGHQPSNRRIRRPLKQKTGGD